MLHARVQEAATRSSCYTPCEPRRQGRGPRFPAQATRVLPSPAEWSTAEYPRVLRRAPVNDAVQRARDRGILLEPLRALGLLQRTELRCSRRRRGRAGAERRREYTERWRRMVKAYEDLITVRRQWRQREPKNLAKQRRVACSAERASPFARHRPSTQESRGCSASSATCPRLSGRAGDRWRREAPFVFSKILCSRSCSATACTPDSRSPEDALCRPNRARARARACTTGAAHPTGYGRHSRGTTGTATADLLRQLSLRRERSGVLLLDLRG
jgi:hypothetical protein